VRERIDNRSLGDDRGSERGKGIRKPALRFALSTCDPSIYLMRSSNAPWNYSRSSRLIGSNIASCH